MPNDAHAAQQTSKSHTRKFFIGVDVGTGSARAGLFSETGTLLASSNRPITIWRDTSAIVEQSSEEIWLAVCASVREAVGNSRVAAQDIAAVGFDATCSLVVVKADGSPVAVGPSEDPNRNIIVWMDHRAAGEAAEINAGKHGVLRYVGGQISPEMQTPKLLWLKRNLPKSFADAGHFFDLSDYLTWRSTGSLNRSVCTVTCKWTYLAHEKRWDASFFERIGLGELADQRFSRIGSNIVDPGSALGEGLTAKAAEDLGLLPGTAVAAALIDAHAGGLGTLGSKIEGQDSNVQNRLAYVFGTSACSMSSTGQPVFVDGVWGPYYSAMIPGLWLNEGGQSAAGAAIDHLVSMHPASAEARRLAEAAGMSLITWLERQTVAMSGGLERAVELAKDIHVVPEFLGNRSPFADPDARAVVAGLGLESDTASLVSLYIAGLSGIGYGLRQLLEKFSHNGIAINVIVASGGAAQSNLVCQMLADATNVPVAAPSSPEPVLLGAAMLAAAASGRRKNLGECITLMSGNAQLFNPTGGATGQLHLRRFRAFEILQNAGRDIRTLI